MTLSPHQISAGFRGAAFGLARAHAVTELVVAATRSSSLKNRAYGVDESQCERVLTESFPTYDLRAVILASIRYPAVHYIPCRCAAEILRLRLEPHIAPSPFQTFLRPPPDLHFCVFSIYLVARRSAPLDSLCRTKMAPTRSNLRVGLNKGFPTTPIPKAVKPSHKKGIKT